MRRARRHGLRRLFFMTLALAGAGMAASAANALPCMAIEMTAKPQDRAALLADMKGAQNALLARWQKAGLVTGYHLLFTRASDDRVWDAMMLLTFADESTQTRWRTQLSPGSGGIAPEALGHVLSVETTPCDSVRQGGPNTATNPVALVVPYVALIPPTQYLEYLDGYTIPQFRGWVDEGVLDSYEVITSRFPAGRTWNAVIFLRYRDDAALARRDEIVAKVRAGLSQSATWKSFSDSKKAIRTEGRLAVADYISDK